LRWTTHNNVSFSFAFVLFPQAQSVAPLVSSSLNQRDFFAALLPSTNGPKRMHQSTMGPPSIITDVVPDILSFCDARTLSRASCVCRSWSIMANSNDLWTELCKEIFGVSPSELNPAPDPTRMLYVMSHLKLRYLLCHGGPGGSGAFHGSGNNHIPVISASLFRSFGRLRMDE
jgi:hypothetical protein